MNPNIGYVNLLLLSDYGNIKGRIEPRQKINA